MTGKEEDVLVQCAGGRNQSFASLDQSVADTDTDECHFWSKVSTPLQPDDSSFVGEDVVESPLADTGYIYLN